MRKKANQRPFKGVKKKPNRLFGFFHRYWMTFALIVALTTLIRQNFLINEFPASLTQRMQAINQNIRINQALDDQNTIQKIELNATSATNMEVLESQARYRFGFIKAGERYYQIHELAPKTP